MPFLKKLTSFRKTTRDSTQVFPLRKIFVGRRWVFNAKYNSKGSINKFKERLVAKGFTHFSRIDYAEHLLQ